MPPTEGRRGEGSVRVLRVARDLQRRLALAIAEGVGMPAPALVLTRVRMSPDLSHARVYYVMQMVGKDEETSLDPEEARRLAHALRHHLARNWTLRRLPAIDLVLDQEWTEEERMLALLHARDVPGEHEG